MSLTFNRKDFVYNMTHKGFEADNTGSGHLGLFLVDESGRRTHIRTGVPLGGHGHTLGVEYIKRMAKSLHITPKDLNLYQACERDHSWLMKKLRTDGWLSPPDKS